ncbi:hypothetical protein X777_14450 [Ooceraea biroi]|uniref:CCHC-type domain-containing protein n=1 Tax=Ooceraea biroi TaxID=2015173 RepID=A0A026VYU1_OOCBI|nr:hypothetical protein X777_14450 [Ooceraea biroi]
MDPAIKVVYSFPPKGRKYTSCVVEVSSEVRSVLRREPRIYICYSACRFADYVRTLQCFRCLGFGHTSTGCGSSALCGHCSERHDTRECTNKNREPVCANCKRWLPHDDIHHAATDGRKCPIIRRRIMEKIKTINYGCES